MLSRDDVTDGVPEMLAVRRAVMGVFFVLVAGVVGVIAAIIGHFRLTTTTLGAAAGHSGRADESSGKVRA